MALTREQSRTVAQTAIASMADWNGLLIKLQSECTPDDFAATKSAVSKVMGEISVEILTPILTQYPDLEPQSVERWRLAGDLPNRSDAK